MVVCLQDSVRSIVCSVIGRLACVGRRATRLHYREGLLQRSLLSALQVNMIIWIWPFKGIVNFANSNTETDLILIKILVEDVSVIRRIFFFSIKPNTPEKSDCENYLVTFHKCHNLTVTSLYLWFTLYFYIFQPTEVFIQKFSIVLQYSMISQMSLGLGLIN